MVLLDASELLVNYRIEIMLLDCFVLHNTNDEVVGIYYIRAKLDNVGMHVGSS